MGAGRAIAIAGGGALAAYALHRASQPAGAPDDGGYTAVTDQDRPVQDHAQETERVARRGLRVPCGAPRVAYADLRMDGAVGATFEVEWASQTRSLAKKYGSLSWVGFETGRPAVTAECALAWIDMWLDAWWRARSREPIRYTVGAANLSLKDAYTVPEGGGGIAGNLLGEEGWSSLGRAWRELVKVRNLAVWLARDSKSASEPGKPFLHAARAAEALRVFAVELDKSAARELSGHAVDEALDAAKSVGRGLAGGVAWVVGEVLGPIAGAVVSTVLPYVAIGGVLYIVVRKQAA